MTKGQTLISLADGAFRNGFGAVLEIAPTDSARFYIDGREASCRIQLTIPGGCKPDGVWRAGVDTLARIFEGGRALESAYLSGRIKIGGDMSVMARLVLESSI